jgi:hypothetical protein
MVCQSPIDVSPMFKAYSLGVNYFSRTIFVPQEGLFLFTKLQVYDSSLKIHIIIFDAFFHNIATDKIFNLNTVSYNLVMTMSILALCVFLMEDLMLQTRNPQSISKSRIQWSQEDTGMFLLINRPVVINQELSFKQQNYFLPFISVFFFSNIICVQIVFGK